MPRISWSTLVLTILVFGMLPVRSAEPPYVHEAVTWYDTLGYPNAKDLPYVRVATGRATKTGNQPFENSFVEGFLLGEEAGAFTVFIGSVSKFRSHWDEFEPYPPLTTERFVLKVTGPDYERVGYEILDFPKVAAEALERVKKRAPSRDIDGLRWGRPVSHRVRIFAFARACAQKRLADTATTLEEIATNIPQEQTGNVEPERLRENLQQQIGEAALEKGEVAALDPAISRTELLKTYADFPARFPASTRIAYAHEAATALEVMIAEDAAHHPKPLAEMSPAEQVAENIYQLRDVKIWMWTMHGRYPIDARKREGEEEVTPVHRLVDLGEAAIPQLIAALEDRRFTRSPVPSWHGEPARAMRVGDFAQRILEHMSGRNFYPRRADDGHLIAGTTRQQAEAWWAEMQAKGEKKQLTEVTAAGGEGGSAAAYKLVEKYPDAAIGAIEKGFRVTPEDGVRCQYIQAAAKLPGEAPVAFLRSTLAKKGTGLYSQSYAAQALFTRSQPDVVPAMIDAWKAVQPRLLANEGDAYGQVGYVITFLAKSGHAEAIDALAHDFGKVPLDVRLAIVTVFLPWPKSSGMSSIGPSVHVEADIPKLPAGEAGAAIERLLLAALADPTPRLNMQGHYDEIAIDDPRICDFAALVLSKRWPEKYPFQWSPNTADRDTQIGKLREPLKARE